MTEVPMNAAAPKHLTATTPTVAIDAPFAAAVLSDLPDELLQQILIATNCAQTVVACAQVCSTWASLARSEELWEVLYTTSWPLAHRLPHALPASLDSACNPWLKTKECASSWRMCHRARCLGTPAGTWRKLLPLYDESVLLAAERPGGWIGRLGSVLLRIRNTRKVMETGKWPAVANPHEVEGVCWLRSFNEALMRPQAVDELLAFAGGMDALAAAALPRPSGRVETAEEEVMRRGGISAWLDEWYDNNNNNAPALLLRFLAGRSALQEIFGFKAWNLLAAPGSLNALSLALGRVDASIRSLHQEGCDLSVTAAQQITHAAGVPISNWWWRLEAPAYGSGGTLFIAPLPAGDPGY